MAESGPYLLGLDAGNTVIKAVVFDTAGRQLAMHAIDGRSSSPRPGHVERDVHELWANAKAAIRTAIGKAGIDPASIAAVGCAGHGNGLYLLDKSDRPLLGVQSLDSRAAALSAELATRDGDAFHAICLQKPWPSQTPTLLAWVKRRRPELYGEVGTVMLCKDVITFRLTGERVSDISDMSGCGLVRMPEGVYDEALLSLYRLDDAYRLLPRLADPTEIVGRMTASAAAETGLAQGTPVVGGYFDVVASAMGSGVVRPGEASIIAGTWSINQVFSAEPVVDPGVFMVARFGAGRFVNIESSATSAANLEWYVRELIGHDGDPFRRVNALVGAVKPASDDPFFHPFFYGSRLGAGFRAGFNGIAGWHGEGHLVRALFEGVAFEHRRHIEVLAKAGVTASRAVLSGGGAQSTHWRQIFADVLGIAITTAETTETGALGAALGAGVGVGIFPDYEPGVAAMTRVKAVYQPNPAMRQHYDRRYALYTDLTERLRPFWDALATGEPERG